MCVCIYIYIYTCMYIINISIDLSLSLYIYIYIIHTHLYIYIYIYIYTHTYVFWNTVEMMLFDISNSMKRYPSVFPRMQRYLEARDRFCSTQGKLAPSPRGGGEGRVA